MSERASSRLQALFCALMLPLCALVIHPHVEIGLNDDWSYIRTAQLFARTGHFIYNGWGAPYQGWQTLFAALFIRIFGFSFSITRDSVLVLAMAAAFLAHRIFVRCGIGATLATLGTLSFFLSPLCLPLVFSFMTDVPSLLVIELCLYACLRALQSTSSRSALAWILFATFSNVLGGTNRQVGWIGLFVMVPCTLWLLRHWGPRLLAIGGVSFFIASALVAGLVLWFGHHPDLVAPTMPHRLEPWDIARLENQLTRLALEVVTLLLPLLCIALIALVSRHGVMAVALLAIVLVDLYLRHTHGDAWLAPYLVNSITPHGLLDGTAIHGDRPTLFDRHLRILFTVLIDAGIAALFMQRFAKQPATARADPQPTVSSHQLWMLLGPFAAVYVLLLTPSAAFITLFDRYSLPLAFIGTLALLRSIHPELSPRVFLASLAIPAVYAALTIAATHDAFAMFHARLAALQELQAANIPATSIDGALEFNAWTQIERTGKVRVTGPPEKTAAYDAYNNLPHPCSPFSALEFPDLDPKYALSFDPNGCSGPTSFAPVVYHQWLGRHTVPIYIIHVQPDPIP